VKHYYEEIGFELIRRAQSLSPPSDLRFNSYLILCWKKSVRGKEEDSRIKRWVYGDREIA
jgi:hypothetical protein